MIEILVSMFVTLFLTQTLIFYRMLRNKQKQLDEYHVTPRDRGDGLLDYRSSSFNHNTSHYNDTIVGILRILSQESGVTASVLSKRVNKSREHVSRVLKLMSSKGLVRRYGKPFKYSITDKGREVIPRLTGLEASIEASPDGDS